MAEYNQKRKKAICKGCGRVDVARPPFRLHGINSALDVLRDWVDVDCLFVCGISLTSGQLISELFPDCTRSCFSQVVSMRFLFVAVGPNARFIVLPHWDNMS